MTEKILQPIVNNYLSSSHISKSKTLCSQHDGQSQQSPFTQNVITTSVFKQMYPLQLSKKKLQHFSYMKGMVTSTTSICRRGDSSHSSYRLYIFQYHYFNTSVSQHIIYFSTLIITDNQQFIIHVLVLETNMNSYMMHIHEIISPSNFTQIPV